MKMWCETCRTYTTHIAYDDVLWVCDEHAGAGEDEWEKSDWEDEA